MNLSTLWDLRLWSDGITYDETNYPNYYVGTGEKLCVYFYSDPLTLNDDNEYYLPDGDFTPSQPSGDGGTSLNPGVRYAERRNMELRLSAGELAFACRRVQHYGKRTDIGKRTATVTRNAARFYTITFDFTSDAKYSVTGTFEARIRDSRARLTSVRNALQGVHHSGRPLGGGRFSSSSYRNKQ